MVKFDAKAEYEYLQDKMLKGNLLTTSKNNVLLYHFLESKRNGGYARIVYLRGAVDYKTLVKKARNIIKIERYFKKDFDKLDENQVLKFRDELNNNKINCDKTLVKWKEVIENSKKVNRSYFEIIPTDRPLSYRTKTDYKENFVEFYRFIMEYIYQTEHKEIKDVTKFFLIMRPSDFEEIKVNFMTDEEIQTFLANVKNRDFKAMVQLNLMSGARPSEIVKVKYGKSNNLYRNTQGKWIVHLPKIKRISYKKFPFEIDMYEDELCPYFDSLSMKEGDFVFKTTEKTYRKLMKYYSLKFLGKNYSPKVLRKTARMIRTNAGYSHDWINKLMGHAPGSKVQAHYTNYEGIKNQPDANEKLKGQQYPSLKREYESLKLELKAIKQQSEEKESQMKKITDQFNQIEEKRRPADELLSLLMRDEEILALVARKAREKGLSKQVANI